MTRPESCAGSAVAPAVLPGALVVVLTVVACVFGAAVLTTSGIAVAGPLGAVLLVKARLNVTNPAVTTVVSAAMPAIRMRLVDMEWFYPFGFVFR